MADKDQVSTKFYTINNPEFEAFKSFCNIEPMCKDWNAKKENGWRTISVPNWTAEVRDFYKMISDRMNSHYVAPVQASWFEGINPEVARNKGLTAPECS